MNALLLHRRVMHPVHPSLCFFGMLSTLGNEAAVGELQGRWACAMLTGTGAIRCTRALVDASVAKRRVGCHDVDPPCGAPFLCSTLLATLLDGGPPRVLVVVHG